MGLFNKKYENNEQMTGAGMEMLVIQQTAEVLKEVTHCFKEYSICKEHEKTERKRISSQLKAYIKKVDAIKDIELQRIQLTHEERMKLLEAADKALEIARQNGDLRIAKMTFDFINVTINKIGYINGAPNDRFLIE